MRLAVESLELPGNMEVCRYLEMLYRWTKKESGKLQRVTSGIENQTESGVEIVHACFRHLWATRCSLEFLRGISDCCGS